MDENGENLVYSIQPQLSARSHFLALIWETGQNVHAFLNLGFTNLISGSTDPTDPVFAESRKNKKRPKHFYMHVK